MIIISANKTLNFNNLKNESNEALYQLKKVNWKIE